MSVLMKKFLRPLIFTLIIIFVTFGVTGCASTIRTLAQAEKAGKVLKSAAAVGDVIELKRNASDLLDKILKHR